MGMVPSFKKKKMGMVFIQDGRANELNREAKRIGN
jgi:hypothetical protein